VDGGHETFDDAIFVVDDLFISLCIARWGYGGRYLCEGGETIGCAGGVGDNGVIRIIGIEIYTAYEHRGI